MLTEKAEERCSIGLQSGAPLTNLCARAFKFEKESDRSRHDELKYRSSVCRGDMGEDREIGASVLAGACARPVPRRPRSRGVRSGGSAPAAGISRGGDRRGPTGMAGARGASLPWRGERSLGCPRSAARAGYLRGGPASRAAGGRARGAAPAVGRVRPCPASSRRHRPQIPNRCQVRRCGHVAFFLRDKHTRRSPAGPAARRQTRAPCHRDGAAHAAPLRECPVDEPLGPACSRSSH